MDCFSSLLKDPVLHLLQIYGDSLIDGRLDRSLWRNLWEVGQISVEEFAYFTLLTFPPSVARFVSFVVFVEGSPSTFDEHAQYYSGTGELPDPDKDGHWVNVGADIKTLETFLVDVMPGHTGPDRCAEYEFALETLLVAIGYMNPEPSTLDRKSVV